MTVRRALVALAVLIGGLGALSAGTVFAHAELISSNPANQSILPATPPEIVLRFSEGVEPVGDSIRVVDAAGDPVALGPIDQSLGNDTLRAPVPGTIDDGTYVVGWQAISADSHRIRGAFTFSVGAATPTAPGVIDDIFAGGDSASSESILLGAGRFLSFAGTGVLVGALFLAAVLVPELIGDRRIGRLLVVAAVTAAAGTVAMFLGQAHLIAGSYLAWGDVIGTRSGQWWLARLVAIALFAMFIPARSFLTSRMGRVEIGVAGLIVFGVVAAGGHAVSGDSVALGFGATVVHLAAMAIWLGGLVLLLAGLPRNWFWWTASQFSPWALGAVIALAVTGSANAWRQLGSLDGITESAYGRWLVIKLVLVAGVVTVAFFSRRMSRSDDPATAAGSVDEVAPLAVGAAVAESQEPPPALRRTVALEVAGMALILMATAGLVNSPPPPSAATTESASVVVGERIAQVELDPAVTGGTEMHVYLSSPGGGLDRADEITVEASLPAADLGPLEVEVVPAGPNHVIGPAVDLPVAGLWTFEVTARYGEFDQVVFTVQLPVTD